MPVSESITFAHIDCAKERLIRERATHLDSLAARLRERRVVRVIEPLITGEPRSMDSTFDDDVTYLRDLGLIAQDNPMRIANPIYQEVVPRILAIDIGKQVTAKPSGYLTDDGGLDFEALLTGFTSFWKLNGEAMAARDNYHEVAAQLVLMGYLDRLINGGGFIDREYGVGKGRIDIPIRWPYTDRNGQQRVQREALELKVRRSGRPDPLEPGLEQLDAYLDRLSMNTGTLVIFDLRPDAADITERTSISTTASPAGRQIRLLRC